MSPPPPLPRANLSEVLSSNRAHIQGIARAGLQGNVLEVEGEMDSETVCAVVAMAAKKLGEAASEVGLGSPKAWHVSLASSVFYVVHRPEELLVMCGGATRNPTAMLKTLAKSCEV